MTAPATPEFEPESLPAESPAETIRELCDARVKGYREQHDAFSRRDELYFFCGVTAVLDCLQGEAIEALNSELVARMMSFPHSPHLARLSDLHRQMDRPGLCRLTASLHYLEKGRFE